MKKKILFIVLLFINQFLYSQTRNFIVDKNINPDTIVLKDTMVMRDYSDTTNTKTIKIPINASVKSDSFHTLENCLIYNDSSKTIIHLSSLTPEEYAVLTLTLKNETYTTYLYLNAIYIEGTEIKVKDCELRLNTDNFKTGQLLVGILSFTYDGKAIEYGGFEHRYVGKYSGVFKAIIKDK